MDITIMSVNIRSFRSQIYGWSFLFLGMALVGAQAAPLAPKPHVQVAKRAVIQTTALAPIPTSPKTVVTSSEKEARPHNHASGPWSATPIPYEGIVSLSDLHIAKKIPEHPQKLKEAHLPASPPPHPVVDCTTCKTHCSPPLPASLDLTPLQIVQSIENAGNPAIRRALLLALKNKDVTLFSILVSEYDLLNVVQ